jgi:hypothetical protein
MAHHCSTDGTTAHEDIKVLHAGAVESAVDGEVFFVWKRSVDEALPFAGRVKKRGVGGVTRVWFVSTLLRRYNAYMEGIGHLWQSESP